jgi:hypothetical protein
MPAVFSVFSDFLRALCVNVLAFLCALCVSDDATSIVILSTAPLR